MTDENNDPTAMDGSDQESTRQTPPPLIAPPVRADETGERASAETARSDDGDLVEPTTDQTDEANPVFSDVAGDRQSARDEPSGVDDRDDSDEMVPADEPTANQRGAHPAFEERPLDESPVVATSYSNRDASPSSTVGDRDTAGRDPGDHDATDRDHDTRDHDTTDHGTRDHDTRDRDTRDRDTTDHGTTARAVVADREAVRDTVADAEPVAVAPTPGAAPMPILIPAAQQTQGAQQTAAYPPAPAFQREFREPPVEPKKRGNRGVGSLIAFLSVILFAIIYSLIAAAIIASQRPQDLGEIFLAFVKSPVFLIPTIIFVIAFVIVVLLANRAAWWAYVLGSLLVGALVYFGTIGVALIISNPTALTLDEARQLIVQRAIDPFLITAALVAREVSLWTGSAIASRGRRMKARNVTAREDYERASAEHRAEYERSYPTAG